ncbi:MAG: DUF4268 domain-containing protein [Chloroflexi bacterium]|nr:DUF4268 domain-containing protein [Chloroflexota bacterium]MDE2708224.1 DUF4268 domain-containing protein [Chloroflexota bacterium]
MPKQKLGEVEDVPLRKVFDDEPNDFTPWLAKNLELLGNVMDLNLAWSETEGRVGALSVDIVAESDLGEVVIENQIERSNHTHLGQLLSYAAGRRAKVLVWVASDFKEEHRAALDWLNDSLPEDTEVWGIEVRVIRIGDSKPAPELRAVAFPNSFSRQSRASTDRGTSPWTRDDYRDFYQPIFDALREKDFTTERKPSGGYSQGFPTEAELEGVEYRISLTTPKVGHSANVYVYLGAADAEYNLKVFGLLEERKDAIQEKLGPGLIWRHARGYRPAISLVRPVSLLDPPEKLGEVQDWMIESLPRLRDAFEPVLLEIGNELQSEEAHGVEDGSLGDDVD